MWNQLSWTEKIVGTWAVAAGVSLLWTFFKQYRARGRYLYLPFISLWAILFGIGTLRQAPVLPRFAMWALFLLGVAAMFRDSIRRYRETSARLREERVKRLRGDH